MVTIGQILEELSYHWSKLLVDSNFIAALKADMEEVAIALDSLIYFFEGIGELCCNIPASYVLVYSPKNDVWSQKSAPCMIPMRRRRIGHGIYIFLNTVQIYNPKTVATVDGNVYLFG